MIVYPLPLGEGVELAYKGSAWVVEIGRASCRERV